MAFQGRRGRRWLQTGHGQGICTLSLTCSGAAERRSELPLCFCEEIVLCLLVGQESQVSLGAEFTATDLGVTRLSHEKQAGRSVEPK